MVSRRFSLALTNARSGTWACCIICNMRGKRFVRNRRYRCTRSTTSVLKGRSTNRLPMRSTSPVDANPTSSQSGVSHTIPVDMQILYHQRHGSGNYKSTLTGLVGSAPAMVALLDRPPRAVSLRRSCPMSFQGNPGALPTGSDHTLISGPGPDHPARREALVPPGPSRSHSLNRQQGTVVRAPPLCPLGESGPAEAEQIRREPLEPAHGHSLLGIV